MSNTKDKPAGKPARKLTLKRAEADAAPAARLRAATQRRDALIGQWLRGLRARADITTRP